eukprot:6313120-Amphidinium_carterae.1
MSMLHPLLEPSPKLPCSSATGVSYKVWNSHLEEGDERANARSMCVRATWQVLKSLETAQTESKQNTIPPPKSRSRVAFVQQFIDLLLAVGVALSSSIASFIVLAM